MPLRYLFFVEAVLDGQQHGPALRPGNLAAEQP
jgi:hypothetical protein